jgi:hypothetical protein
MEKLLEKIKEILGSSYISTDGITLSIRVNVELDEGQYNELINMLNSMGYSLYNKGVGEKGLMMEVYHNNHTGEFIAIDYMKNKKYVIWFIIYYWDRHELYA